MSNNRSPSPRKAYKLEAPYGTDSDDSPNVTLSSPSISRFTRYDWNKPRDPILDGDGYMKSGSKKQVPEYFESLDRQHEENMVWRKSLGTGPSPNEIDASRAGIPTVIRKIRLREEDLYVPPRPSTAPAATMSFFNGSPRERYPHTRRPCQNPKLTEKRNPILEGGYATPPRRTLLGTGKQSEEVVWTPSKRAVSPPSSARITRSSDHYIPYEEPASTPTKMRTYVPEDNTDVFKYRHSMGICASEREIMLEKETHREQHEKALEDAYRDQVRFYNDAIKRFQQKNTHRNSIG